MKGKKKCPACGKMISKMGLTNHLKAHERRDALQGAHTLTPVRQKFNQAMTVNEPTDPPLTEAELKHWVDKACELEHENAFLKRRIKRYQTALTDLTELLDLTLDGSE